MFDLDHPFFRPLALRLAIVGLCLGWGVFEFATDSPFWGTVFGGVGLVAAWRFFVNYNPRDEP